METSQRWVMIIVVSFVAVGVGCGIWFGFFRDIHEAKRTDSVEERAAQYVGAAERPKSKIKINIADEGCVHLTRVDLDGSELTMYAQNDCTHTIRYMEWKWQTISPDGTYLKAGYENTASCPVPIQPHSKAECRAMVTRYGESLDDRVASLQVGIFDAH